MFELDEVAIKALVGSGLMVMLLSGDLWVVGLLDAYRNWKARRAPASKRVATIDWLDPGLRQN